MSESQIVGQSRGADEPAAASPRRRLALGVAAALLMCVQVPVTQAQEAPQRLPTLTLRAGMHKVTAEVATTPREHAIGLMHRTDMGTHEGMLFIFERPTVQCFWMKNTLIPLSIAFIDDSGTVVNTAEMKPRSLDQHCSSRPVRHALEMNQGWFTKRGIGPGFKLQGQPFAPGP